ncbi:hypothetical protein Acr_02g0010940 [Actinidia rufa]|uniref:Transposase (putative) gypsy type domain-containing protein n=1 Tax=Actinidia rufa TaxID=165716 RepID=A0A7J0E8N6_9ERIC|nr:hypothetical protein Acr_02g0010940 [Actinidia rufa]
MTQGELDRLRESCSFSSSIQIRLPEADETILSPRPGEVAVYEAAFYAGLCLLIHPTIRRILHFYNIYSAQLVPNAWHSVICTPNSEWLYFMVKLKKPLFGDTPITLRGERRNYSSSRRITGSSPKGFLGKLGFQRSRGHRAPQSSTSRSFSFKSKSMASSGGDNAEDKLVGDAAPIAVGNQAAQAQAQARKPAISRRISLKKLAQLAEGSTSANPMAKSTPVAKGPPGKEPRPTLVLSWGSKPPCWKNPAMAEKLLERVIPPADKEKVEKLNLDRAISKFFQIVGQAVVIGFCLAGHDKEMRDEAMTQQAQAALVESKMIRAQKLAVELERQLRLEKKVSELKKNEALAKKLAIEEYKSSNDFQEAIEFIASKYFCKGFDLCKGQIGRLHPDLDIQDMGIDTELLEEEDEAFFLFLARRLRLSLNSASLLSLSKFKALKLGIPIFIGTTNYVLYTREYGVSPLWTLLIDHPVGDFHLTISLRMTWGGEMIGDAELEVEVRVCQFPTKQMAMDWSLVSSRWRMESRVRRSRRNHRVAKYGRHGGISWSKRRRMSNGESTVSVRDVVEMGSHGDGVSRSSHSYSEWRVRDGRQARNVILGGDLDRQRETYSFPLGVRTRIPGKGETVLSAGDGEVAFYEAAFHAGLRFPRHPTIKQILNFYNICFAQLSPNAWRSIVFILVRLGKKILKEGPSNVKGWKKRFFFVSRDDWEFHPSIPREEGAVRVRGHGELWMSSSGGGMAEDDIGGKAKGDIKGRAAAATGDASKSSHSKDVPRLEVPSQDDSVEFIGIIGKEMRRILPHALDFKSVKMLAKVVVEKTATSSSKGMVISKASEIASKKRTLDDGSKGKKVTPLLEAKKAKIGSVAQVGPTHPHVPGEGGSAKPIPGEALGPHALVMASAATVEKILARVILPTNKEKVEKLTFDKGALAEESAKGKRIAKKAETKNKEMARLEARVAELEKNDIEMDCDFLAKEEAEAEEKKRKAAEGRGEDDAVVEEGEKWD